MNVKEHDEATAALYWEHAKAEQAVAIAEGRIIRAPGPKERLWGAESKRGWGSEEIHYSLTEAIDLIEHSHPELIDALSITRREVTELWKRITDMEAQY